MAEEIRGLSVKFDADFSEFRKGMSQADKDISSTQRQLKSLQSSLKLEFDDKKFTAAQEKAQQALEATEQKAELLRQRLSQMEAAGVTDSTRAEYNYLQETLAKTELSGQQLQQTLEELDKVKTANLTKGLDTIKTKADAAANATRGISLAAAGVVAGLGALAVSSYSAVAEIDDLAQRSGISAQKIQELQYVSTQTGVSTQKLVQALIKARSAYTDLGTGNINNQTKALEALGIAYGDLSQDEVFDAIINNLSKIDDQTLQTAYANEIFGDRVANELIPLLNAGDEALAQFKEEFAGFDTLSDEQVAAMATMDDQIFRMKEEFKNVQYQLAESLIPVMSSFVSLLEEDIIPAIQSLFEWFGNLDEGAQKFIITGLLLIAGLSPMLKLFSGIISLSKGVVTALNSLAKAGATTYLKWLPLVATVGALFYVLSNWTKMNPVQQIVALLGVLSAAALSAAVAFGVFHSAWSLGLAVARIAAGIATAVAAVKAAGEEIGAEVSFDQNSYTSAVSIPDVDTSSLQGSSGNSYTSNTSSDQYNVTINVTEPGASAQEIAEAVSKQIATLAQSRG